MSVGAEETTYLAIMQQGKAFRALRLGEGQGRPRVLEFIEISDSEASWEHFCKYIHSSEQQADRIVIGYDSSMVSFYNITIPRARTEEMESIVRLRAESMLPLPLEQMEYAWRAQAVEDGKTAVTIAAGRIEPLKRFVSAVRNCHPEKIVLDAEVATQTWRVLCGGGEGEAVVLYAGAENTRVCYCRGGLLTDSVTLDYKAGEICGAGANEIECERLCQDMVGVFEHFKLDGTGAQIAILNSGCDLLAGILSGAGFKAEIAEVSWEAVEIACERPADIEPFAMVLGLAMTATEGDCARLNIFKNIYEPARRRQKAGLKELPTLKKTALIAAGALIAFCLMGYGLDWLKLNRLKAYSRNADPNLSVEVRLEQERIRKAVAADRPDMLDLLGKINSVKSEGVTLTSLSFRKGQHVSIGGLARDHGALYGFQEGLLRQSGITNAEVQKAVRDEKKGQVSFSLVFDYRNFSKRQKPL